MKCESVVSRGVDLQNAKKKKKRRKRKEREKHEKRGEAVYQRAVARVLVCSAL